MKSVYPIPVFFVAEGGQTGGISGLYGLEEGCVQEGSGDEKTRQLVVLLQLSDEYSHTCRK